MAGFRGNSGLDRESPSGGWAMLRGGSADFFDVILTLKKRCI
jgi:hypothetical protein